MSHKKQLLEHLAEKHGLEIDVFTDKLGPNLVWHYLLACIPCEFQGTTQEKLAEIVRRFEFEYWHEYNQQRYGHKEACFANWLSGLPSAFEVDYLYIDIFDLLICWGLDEKMAQKQQYNWFKIIAAKFVQYCKKNNVKF